MELKSALTGAPVGNRKLFWLLLTAALAVIAALIPLGCTSGVSQAKGESAFQKTQASKTLRIGYIVAPPWVAKDPSGKLVGTSVDTIEEVARLADWKLTYTESTFENFATDMVNGRYDLSIAPTFSTVPRAKLVAFGRPQMFVGNSAIIRQGDSRFKSLSDIDKKGVTVAVTAGEAGNEFAKANFKNATIKVITEGDQSTTFSEVLDKRADVALGDAWFTSQFARVHPQVVDLFASKPYNVTPVGWSTRYEDLDLLNFIDTSLDYLESIGKLDEIDAKYEAKWLRPVRSFYMSGRK